jgi:acyl-CoA thioester hydrolase
MSDNTDNLSPDPFDQDFYRYWRQENVRFNDLDMLGHVNNNMMGSYFENARVGLIMETCPDWPRGDYLFVLASITYDFYHELHYGYDVKVGTKLVRFGRSSMILQSTLWRTDNQPIATSKSVSVLIDQKTRRPMEIPADLRSCIVARLGTPA